MREERYGKLIHHDTVELSIHCIRVLYPVQPGLYVGDRSEVDINHRSFVR